MSQINQVNQWPRYIRTLRKIAINVQNKAKEKNISDIEICKELNMDLNKLTQINLGLRVITKDQAMKLASLLDTSIGDIINVSNISDEDYSKSLTNGKVINIDELDMILNIIGEYIMLRIAVNNHS